MFYRPNAFPSTFLSHQRPCGGLSTQLVPHPPVDILFTGCIGPEFSKPSGNAQTARHDFLTRLSACQLKASRDALGHSRQRKSGGLGQTIRSQNPQYTFSSPTRPDATSRSGGRDVKQKVSPRLSQCDGRVAHQFCAQKFSDGASTTHNFSALIGPLFWVDPLEDSNLLCSLQGPLFSVSCDRF